MVDVSAKGDPRCRGGEGGSWFNDAENGCESLRTAAYLNMDTNLYNIIEQHRGLLVLKQWAV
jgi:hypothetical protein